MLQNEIEKVQIGGPSGDGPITVWVVLPWTHSQNETDFPELHIPKHMSFHQSLLLPLRQN